ncbi:hypothetical protein AB0N17_41980 [Streptomyces sp. NPDC051133]|uniref:hypothetical protein n=1 Tax=Streptomyces sp. NPDC051133 TaxID=3155521 RepID=UPI003431C3DE
MKKTKTVEEYLSGLQAPAPEPKTKSKQTVDAGNASVQRGLTSTSAQTGITTTTRGFRR